MNRRKPESKPPPDLREIQRAFGRAVMRPLDGDSGMQRTWTNGRPATEMASAFIKPNDRLDSFERLEIYNRQYWFRLIDSIHEDFPALRAVLGDERFYDLTVAYLTKNPSRSFTLRDLGERMEAFVKRNPERTTPHEKLALDIVRLEWAHIVAFDGAELPPLELDDLLGSDPGTLRLAFQPHLTFLACDYAVDELALAIRRKEFAAVETSNAVTEKARTSASPNAHLPDPEKIWLAVHRLENSVFYKRLDRDAYRLGVALRAGSTLEEACGKILSRRTVNETFPVTLQGWFAQWASFGWIGRPNPEMVSTASKSLMPESGRRVEGRKILLR